MELDVRWVQRFESFERAFALLEEALALDPAKLNALEREGSVQRFEFTFELAWKTLQDFLIASGVIFDLTPRATIKAAFTAKLINDGQRWIDMMLRRNALSHQYDGRKFEESLLEIRQSFLPVLRTFHRDFAQRRSAL